MALYRKPLSPRRIRFRGAVWGAVPIVFIVATVIWIDWFPSGTPPLHVSDPVTVWAIVVLMTGPFLGPLSILVGLLFTRFVQSISARTAHRYKVLLSGVLLGSLLGLFTVFLFILLPGYLSGRYHLFDAEPMVIRMWGITVGMVFGLGCALAVRLANERSPEFEDPRSR